jgi:hypothetical protein
MQRGESKIQKDQDFRIIATQLEAQLPSPKPRLSHIKAIPYITTSGVFCLTPAPVA